MNSVALPASATGTALGAEADLIRRAARGDGESFEELYRRHGQVAWRFGQSVASDQDAAVKAVSEGFGRALRGLRRHSRMDDEGFRPFLLAAIYRSALDNLHSHGAPAPIAPLEHSSGSKGRATRTRNADAAFVAAAFRSLPERWRAAIWLSEVEAMSEDRIAPVLGVSAAVASQLISRGRRGLLGRFEQGRRPMPAHLDATLRPLSTTVPTGLGKSVGERWAALVNDPTARFAPITEWLSDRAVRPLWVSVGGLMGLGLIGLGIVSQSTGVNSGPVASGAVSGNVNGLGINPDALGNHLAPINGGAGFAGFNLPASGSGGSGSFGGFNFGNTSPNSGGNLVGPIGGNPAGPGGPSLPITVPTLPPPPAPPPAPSTNPLLPANPVVSASTGTSGTSATLLPSSSGGTATVSTCGSTGVGLNVDGTAIGCTSTSSTSTSTSTSTITGTLSTTTSTLGGL